MKHPIAESMRVAAALGDPLVFMCPRQARSFDDARKAVIAELAAHDGPLLLLIDGIRGRDLAAMLTTRGCMAQSIFPDDADPELLAVSPMILTVTADAINAVFDQFWGQGIASLCLVQSDVETAHAHLAANIYVETDTGDLCILRLHDPRTLLRLSDVFDDDQLEALMAEVITRFVFEGTAGELHSISSTAKQVPAA